MEIAQLVKDAGALGLALYFLYSFVNGKLYGERAMQRERERGDRLEEMLLTALQAGQNMARVAEARVYEFEDKDKH